MTPLITRFPQVGEATEVALRVLAEKLGLPEYGSMPHSMTMLSKQERNSYCNNHWAGQYPRVSSILLPFEFDFIHLFILLL